jgi:uncharacterized membrane protein SpoIIM required for sporulation
VKRFLDDRKDNWQRLEELLAMQQGIGLRGLSRMEVREFGELYRRAASDLAIARAETRDPKLINYLNSLVIRAHGRIYRAESQGVGIIWQFFAQDFPRAVRKSFGYSLVAFAAFILFAALSFGISTYDPEFAEVIGADDYRIAAETDMKWWLSINEANPIEASNILTNNIRVSLMAFALGALLCVGTLLILAYNGLHIGGILAVCYKTNPAFGNELVTFMVGHGVIELSCIFLCGGAGMMIGYAIVNSGDLTRAQALKKKGVEAAKVVIGCAFLLVVAGFIEGFISPSALPASAKIATGLGTGVAMCSYLFLAGRQADEIQTNSP